MERAKTPLFELSNPPRTQYMEKPLTPWSSGRIKRIYDSYEYFCVEISKLLDPPRVGAKPSKVETCAAIETLPADSWKGLAKVELLTHFSIDFNAGFVVKKRGSMLTISSYFIENTRAILGHLITHTYSADLVSDLTMETLRPERLDILSLVDQLGLHHMGWDGLTAEAVFFPLNSEDSEGVILVTNVPEPKRKDLLLKTQSLIQKHFYD